MLQQTRVQTVSRTVGKLDDEFPRPCATSRGTGGPRRRASPLGLTRYYTRARNLPPGATDRHTRAMPAELPPRRASYCSFRASGLTPAGGGGEKSRRNRARRRCPLANGNVARGLGRACTRSPPTSRPPQPARAVPRAGELVRGLDDTQPPAISTMGRIELGPPCARRPTPLPVFPAR